MAASAIAMLMVLGGCASLPGFGLFAAPPPLVEPAAVSADPVPGTTAADAEEAVPDGRYAGLAILTAFHGDCNAGGTGQIVVHGGTLIYRDDRNPMLSGPLGAHGAVDLASGTTRLSGRFADAVFTGRIAGGACEYQMRFERVPD